MGREKKSAKIEEQDNDPVVEQVPVGKEMSYKEIMAQPRYTVACQDKVVKNCYKHFRCTDKLSEAKAYADAGNKKTGRECVIYDRDSCGGSVYRVGENESPKEVEVEETSEKPKKLTTKKKIIKRKK